MAKVSARLPDGVHEQACKGMGIWASMGKLARAEEERARMAREVQWLVHVSGRNLVRRGDLATIQMPTNIAISYHS